MSFPPVGLGVFLTFLAGQLAVGQTVVNSTFTPHGVGYYGDPNNWSPPEVPNNTAEKSYNITIPQSGFQLRLNVDATVSNVTLDSATILSDGERHNLTVNGATIVTHSSAQQSWDFFLTAPDPAGSTFAAGSLSTFSAGSLTGWYYLSNYTLQFNGAHVTTLSNSAHLALASPLTRIVDELGNDALRDLAHIDSTSSLAVVGREFVLARPFTNEGELSIGAASDRAGLFSITGNLTNFDGTTRTLTGGTYSIIGNGSSGSNYSATLQFAGADIVHNAASLEIYGPLAKIVDQNGADALRNFSHNTVTGVFSVSGRDYSIPGNFTNDGMLSPGGRFTVEGLLTNFDLATGTLTGGSYLLGGSARFVFNGADIKENAASIYLYSGGKILDENGSDALRNFAHNLLDGVFTINESSQFTAAGDFVNAGTVNILGAGDISRAHFTVPEGHRYLQTEGETSLLDGHFTGKMEIAGGSFTTAGNPYFGNAAFLDGDLTIDDALFVARTLNVSGAVHLSPNSRLLTTPDQLARVTVGQTFTAGGILQINALPFPPPSTGVYQVVSAGGGVIGTFSNALNGARIPTSNGLGSFVVSYTPTAIFISDFQAIPLPAQLLNISGRVQVLTGDNAPIAGFIVFGRDPKKVIIRGIGPSLGTAGVGGALQDPILELHAPTGVTINNNWRDTQAAEIQASGLAPTDDRESAIVATLAPGTYTAILRGTNNTTGAGLVEVYDLAQETKSKLANVSTRGFVDPDHFIFGGVIVGGNGNGNAALVVRALGPKLRYADVPGFLPDPTVELRDSHGTLVAFNDDAADPPESAQGIPPALYLFSTRDAALAATVAPGEYTAVVRGKAGASGIALVEIYDLNR